MSRTDHYMGLSPRGRNYVTEALDTTAYDTIVGAFYNEFPLDKYHLRGGKYLYEFVQDVPWAGGPCYFTALRDSEGNSIEDTLWTEEEIREALGYS